MSKENSKDYTNPVGKSVPRIDGKGIVTGQAKYVFDMALPNMLFGKMLRSPHAHARIISINTSKAEKLPGVKAIITAKDTHNIKFGSNESFGLNGSSRCNTRANLCRRLRSVSSHQISIRYRRHLDMDINTVKKGAGYLGSVAVDLWISTLALVLRISKITAWTWIHSGNQHET